MNIKQLITAGIMAMVATAAFATPTLADAMAEITNTVKVTKFHQPYPYSGKATVEYTVGGTLPANAVVRIRMPLTSLRPSAVRCCSPTRRTL